MGALLDSPSRPANPTAIMRLVLVFFAGVLAGLCHANELRWTFDSDSLGTINGKLMGDAVVESIGPSADHFEGLPQSNDALRLDGKGDYLKVEDDGAGGLLDFHQGDPITIEAWVRLDRIGNGQNVYIVGKGRTHRNGAKENQNYALRMRAVSRDARLSFLFRSEKDEKGKSDWHRWTSSRGFHCDGSWHHVAVTYEFGKPDSIRGYVDGEKVGGKWDMGGATKRPPMVDDDDLWIGSSMAGSSGSSLTGAIDEVLIARRILPASDFAGRRIVIQHPPKRPMNQLKPGTVHVTVHEDVGSEAAWPIQLPDPLIEYHQSAFGIARIPMPCGRDGIRRDWKGPVMLTAMAEVDLSRFDSNDGEIEWCLRAGGLSRLWVGETVIAETPAHLGNSSGHGKVIPYHQDDPWLRPPRGGHFEEIATQKLSEKDSGGPTLVTLQTMIGGEGLRYEPGEITVAVRGDSADQWQLLGFQDPIPLTDDGWKQYAAEHDTVLQEVDDQQRRLAASTEDSYWNSRHSAAREYVESLPTLEIPPPIGKGRRGPIGNVVDRFIEARIADAGLLASVADQTSDDQFLRRVYLDTVGVVPSLKEIDAFQALQGDASSRRQAVIDRLLDDHRWADHWTAYWMDVLAENPNVLKPSLNNSGPFRWYLYDVLRDNVAVDRWVTNLLRMEGSKLFGGPAGFGMATQNDVPMAAKAHVVASAFLGANMKCARCHDAPYHDWTQKDLFSMAAMLGRKSLVVPATSSVPNEFFDGESEGESLITLSLSPGEEVESDWALASYTTELPVDSKQLSNPNDTREELAYHITRVENPQFARTIVNRLWQRLMGEGIVEPVDDWEGADPSHPELLEYLSRELAISGFDFKHVARLILNSEAYQRTSMDRPVSRDETKRLFQSPLLRRMTAEQVVDSMHVAVGRTMDANELTFDPEARMKPTAQNNLGLPKRAWELTSLSNERDRPALTLPRAAAVTECMEAFGWKGARQEPINHRQTEPNVVQPGILSGGLLSVQLTRLTDGDDLTETVLQASSVESLVDQLFRTFLTRSPTKRERARFVALLDRGFESRVLKVPALAETPIREPVVSWANHLHPDATDVRLRESVRLRHGPQPSRWLEADWRERFEDSVWALINTPEFLFLP